MTTKHFYFVLVIPILLGSLCCTKTEQKPQGVEVRKTDQGSFFWVDIDHAGDTVDFDIRQLFKSGEMIRLDNSPDALLGRVTDIQISKNYILLYHLEHEIMLFGRDGRFVRKIGHIGKGPFEYVHINGLAMSEEIGLIVGDRAFTRDFVVYSLDGEGLMSFPRSNEGFHQFSIINQNTILDIGYSNYLWRGLATDSINMYLLNLDGQTQQQLSPVKSGYEINVGGVRIPILHYPYKDKVMMHFAQDTLFEYNPGNHELKTSAVFTSSSHGFDYMKINKNISNNEYDINDLLGHIYYEVHAETEDYYLLQGVEVVNYPLEPQAIMPKVTGYYIVDKRKREVYPIRFVDSFWGLDLNKSALYIPFNFLKFCNNRYAFVEYQAIEIKEEIELILDNDPQESINKKLKDLVNSLSEDDNMVMFIYVLK